MNPLRFLVVVAVVLGTLHVPIQAKDADEGPTQAQVNEAIDRGVTYLKSQQAPDGSWSYPQNPIHKLGITALSGLALLESGVNRDDPVIVKADEVVRALAVNANQTYDVVLAILFLAREQPASHGEGDDLIQRLARRLAAGEHEGMWGYNLPVETEAEAADHPLPGLVPKRVRRRPRARVPGPFDHSNTQFGLIGIWAASRHDFDANEALAELDEHFRKTQGPDGRWGYHVGSPGENAMACAGALALAIASSRPELAEKLSARARGAALAADPLFIKAMKAVAEDAKQIGPHSDIYYLWSLERVCVALGLRRLDGLDWYATGARELLRRQQKDGGWPNARWGEMPNTCLALLFLRKANLAFELDRVLRIPDSNKGLSAVKEAGVPAPPSPTDTVPEGGDAAVVVTGASETRFPEIAVEFEVKRPDGSFVIDARAEDFQVTESGAKVPVESLESPSSTEAHPITAVLVLDHSGSMEDEDRIGNLKRAVASFTKGLPKGSRVAVVAFSSEVEVVCPFTDDFARVTTAVDALTPAGATRYYDAVARALEMLKGETGRRAVLALTDGEDTFSQSATLDSVIATARREGLPVHTLGLGSDDEIESGDLKKLAASTRGQYYPARQADQLRTIYEELAARLRSSYTLLYRTDRKLPDGTLRPIRVAYRAGRQAGTTAVFVRGMVVPASGWSSLFLGLLALLIVLGVLPGRLPRGR